MKKRSTKKTILNRDFLYKNSLEGKKLCSHKILKFSVFFYDYSKSSKMSPKTHVRANYHELRIMHKMKIHEHRLSPLLMQKFLFKTLFGHKNVICKPIFKIFAGPITTN